MRDVTGVTSGESPRQPGKSGIWKGSSKGERWRVQDGAPRQGMPQVAGSSTAPSTNTPGAPG